MATGKAETLGEQMTELNRASERLRIFILEKFPLARKRGLKDNDQLLEGGILDSLGMLDLVSFVEQEFAITVSDEDLLPENFQTIERLASFVHDKCAVNSGPDT
jgi:acyl carrier protein